jgi:hypothetical protein
VVNVDHGAAVRPRRSVARIAGRGAVLAVGFALALGGVAGPALAQPGDRAGQVASAAAPDVSELTSGRFPAAQETFAASDEQLRHAITIAEVGKQMKLPPRAMVVAVATALQESTLRNLGHLGDSNDHDSLGLFQQRPSAGWGTPAQLKDPRYAATAFYKGLIAVPSWQRLPVTDATQAVQVSAYPDAYAKWERQAVGLVQASYGAGPYAKRAAALR